MIKFTENQFTTVNDNMSPDLIDFLISTDQMIKDSTLIFLEYVNQIMDETEIPLTNDPDFIASVFKIVKDYETKAAEITLENLENLEIPQKYMLVDKVNSRVHNIMDIVIENKKSS